MEKENKNGAVLQYSPKNNTSLPARVKCSHLGYQELKDYSSTGRERPWTQKKTNSQLISESFSRIADIIPDSQDIYTKKANKISDCGNYLVFQRFIDNSMKLKQAYFCRQRLCTMCNWRRSLKIFSQVSKIMDSMKSDDYDYLFMTLTIRNVDGPELKEAISDMILGFSKLLRRKKVLNTIQGTFRALEVTYNDKDETFHPHLHVVLCVKKSYFTYQYIRQDEWSDMWRKSMKLDYNPIVDIRKIKGDKKAAVAEAAKYATKEEDLFEMSEKGEKKAIDEVVYTLDTALKGRRLIAFTGVFKEYQQKLKLDDAEDGDLIHIDDDAIRPDLQYVIETYNWRCGTYLSKIVDSDIA